MHTAKAFPAILALILLLAVPALAADDAPNDMTAHKLAQRNAQATGQQGPFDPGAGVKAFKTGKIDVNGQSYGLHSDGQVHAGTMLPDGRGDYVWVGSDKPIPMPSAEHAGGREIRLKVREMASQLFEKLGTNGLQDGVAMPASFVNQDNFESSSSFGRYIAEQLFYELNQLGIPVREYRTLPRIMTRPEDGEFALTRSMEEQAPVPTTGLVLTGTYYFDKHNVFVNARLFRPLDGMVLRTANLVFAQTPVTRTMLSRGTGIRLQQAETEVKSFAKLKDEASLEFMLQQDDLH
ncbi:FlgO family outer membrane protein [Desulfovibrio ferrophilus]|uniref:FlgO domain-containing protein n=1 Tax=Desulfovibrio ferrophilus TaxID=241368 RepID=A0A2Z6AXG1_9BACT|nr:FlgO family outer membrane protein [Desulfovibrio ferrophilus]BBD07883.1 uncharacterized protein DFE_1157 [Desulfovibrio ferrophilus]